MAVCQFCDQRNAPGRRHCEKCGAELSRDADSAEIPKEAEPTTELDREVLGLLRTGGKIEAIKRYREATGLGLKESKDAVEHLAEVHNVTPAAGAGCTTVIVALIAMGSLLLTGIVVGAGRWPWQ